MRMSRIILFTRQLEEMTAFYRDVIGLELVTKEKGWCEFDAGGVQLALHAGPPSPGAKGPKVVFFTADVAGQREVLNNRGAKFGKVKVGAITLCDAKDPDGNPIQLSDR